MDNFREYRTTKFLPIGKFLYKIGITANMMSFVSLLLGLSAIYFLFQNHLVFIILGILHLIADGLDGIIARASKSTELGKYFDLIFDRIVAFTALLKVAFYLGDNYFLIICGLFVLTQLIYFLSKLEYPIIFVRTTTLIVLAFSPLHSKILVYGYLVAGIFIVYSLGLQLQWFVKKNFS